MKKILLTVLFLVAASCISMHASIVSVYSLVKSEVSDSPEKKYEPCDPYKYQSNMTMIAVVKQQGVVLADCEVAVLDSQGECRASSFSVSEDGHLVYLVIQGEGAGEALTFRVVYNGAEGPVDVAATETYTYMSDAMVGTFAAPFVLNIPADPTGISSASVSGVRVQPISGALVIEAGNGAEVRIYTACGKMRTLCVAGRQVVSLPAGVYVVNGKKYVVK